MKKEFGLALFVMVAVYAGNGLCLEAGDKPIIRTDKTMYLLDPYYWVYGAAHFKYGWPSAPDPDLWKDGGHEITVNFTLEGYSGTADLPYRLEGLATGEVNGILYHDEGYRAVILIGEEDVGGADFKPGEKDIDNAPVVPKGLTLTVAEDVAEGEPVAVASRTIKINRWGCDRCHLAAEVAREIYPWCNPTGGPLGPHYWGNILGRNGGRPGFTYDNLTDDTLTHTPTAQGIVGGMPAANPLDRPPITRKQMSNSAAIRPAPLVIRDTTGPRERRRSSPARMILTCAGNPLPWNVYSATASTAVMFPTPWRGRFGKTGIWTAGNNDGVVKSLFSPRSTQRSQRKHFSLQLGAVTK